jgi:hypothetical protein
MDIDKLKGLSIGDYVERANQLAELFGKDDPEYAESLALALLKNLFHPEMKDIVQLFGNDDDISNGFFPSDTSADTSTETDTSTEEPVTVTKTTTSVGGLPPDFGATSEEAAAGAVDENPSLIEEILQTPDDQLESFLAEKGLSGPGSTTEEPEKPAEKPAEEPKKPEEKAPEKPVEDKPAEEPKKPEEKKPEEKAPEKPANKPDEKKTEEKKDEPSDTMKNITSALGDRF